VTSTPERLLRFLLPPRIPFQGNRDVDTIQRQRKICWIICIVASLCWVTTWVLVGGKFVKPPKNPIIAISLFLGYTIMSRAALMSMFYFGELRNAYFSLKLKAISERLSAAEGHRWIYTVRLRSFLFDPDLERLEDELGARFLQNIRRAREEKRRQQNTRDQERLQQAHEAVDQEILETSERLGRSYKIRRTLRQNLTLSRKKSLLAELVRFATMGSGAIRNPDQEEAKLSKLVNLLADLADGEICNRAKVLHAEAKKATTFKQKERFMSMAIEVQRAYRRDTNASAEVEPMPETREIFPTQYLRLWERAEEVFSVDGLLPAGMDVEMAKAILLILIDPGSRERIFQKKYRPADRLKKDVMRHYVRIGKPFHPECFDRTVSRLHAEGILFSKPKTDEKMYSLSSKPAVGKSPQAQAIIRKVVETVSVLKS
jgi:hypothetical protein